MDGLNLSKAREQRSDESLSEYLTYISEDLHWFDVSELFDKNAGELTKALVDNERHTWHLRWASAHYALPVVNRLLENIDYKPKHIEKALKSVFSSLDDAKLDLSRADGPSYIDTSMAEATADALYAALKRARGLSPGMSVLTNPHKKNRISL